MLAVEKYITESIQNYSTLLFQNHIPCSHENFDFSDSLEIQINCNVIIYRQLI